MLARHAAIVWSFALVLTSLHPALPPACGPRWAAGAPPGAPEIDAADRAWRRAQERLRATEATQSELEDRIATLKRRDNEDVHAMSPELERLLVRSVAAEDRLASLRARASAARRELSDALRARIRAIDQAIQAQVPRLKSGPLDGRQTAARAIRTLSRQRDRLRARLGDLSATGSSPRRAWSRYEVAIEPLDGPRELHEKADFVEDTRDKLTKKRRALRALIREARQQREVAKAARDFARDIGLFDEESRSTRVGRRGAAGALSEVPESAGGGTPPSGQPPPRMDPPPPPRSGNGAPAPVVPREISPDVLINLRVENLADDPRVDLNTLRRLERELSELDVFLRKRVRTIRRRAEELEEHEGTERR